jgi:hypothetical protein
VLYFPAFLVLVLFEVLVVLVALSLSGALGPRRGVLPLLLAVLVYNLPGGYLFLPGCAPLRCAGGPFAMPFRMREEFLMSDLTGRRLEGLFRILHLVLALCLAPMSRSGCWL